MRHLHGSSLILATGLCLSLAAHAALGFGLSRWADRLIDETAYSDERVPLSPSLQRLPGVEPVPAETRNRPENKELRLGIEDGSAATLTWLGFREATEHQARTGPTDQSAMTLNEGLPGRAAPDVPAPAAQLPPDPPEPAAVTARPSPAPADPPADPLDPEPQVVEPALTSAEQQETQPEIESHELSRELAERIAETTVEAAERLAQSVEQLLAPRPARPEPRPVRESVQTDPASAAPEAAPQPAVSPPESRPGTGGAPGIVSDKEAIATSVREAPVVRPGRVLAAKGLEISTRRPRFGIATRMTRAPKNPVVEITFGPDGRVKRASFVTDGTTVYNTGSDDVDQPLLNAVYSWTAKGKPLSELDASDPGAGVTIVITIILVG